jgi:drug/metabolite transporter (DMT)-like permease
MHKVRDDDDNPIAAGAWVAVLAALAFGATTPIIQRFGRSTGPFVTAALLYAGAALASISAPSKRDAPVRRARLARLLVVACLGAVLAPASLAWGLQRTSAAGASLLLSCEALFTVILAHLVYGEPLGRRVVLAVLAMTAGSALLVGAGRAPGAVDWGIGALAVVVASFGWAADNTLTRPLADLDPSRVVLWKAGLGAVLSAVVAALAGEELPRAWSSVALVACGAVGYGVSLRLYLLAQRRIGAARTGSIFSLAPFIGAAAAWGMGDRAASGVDLAASVLIGVAVALHLTEEHRHMHPHEALDHEHAHRHDDGHHTHRHETPIDGEHSHRHRHEATTHDHPHGVDLHHRHRHD